jgi:hypothetical protein
VSTRCSGRGAIGFTPRKQATRSHWRGRNATTKLFRVGAAVNNVRSSK